MVLGEQVGHEQLAVNGRRLLERGRLPGIGIAPRLHMHQREPLDVVGPRLAKIEIGLRGNAAQADGGSAERSRPKKNQTRVPMDMSRVSQSRVAVERSSRGKS